MSSRGARQKREQGINIGGVTMGGNLQAKLTRRARRPWRTNRGACGEEADTSRGGGGGGGGKMLMPAEGVWVNLNLESRSGARHNCWNTLEEGIEKDHSAAGGRRQSSSSEQSGAEEKKKNSQVG
ncbi:unnamed protein product [Calypogeia fissa]